MMPWFYNKIELNLRSSKLDNYLHLTSITVTNRSKTSSTKAVACCVIYGYTMAEDKMQLDPFGSFLHIHIYIYIYISAGTNIWNITQIGDSRICHLAHEPYFKFSKISLSKITDFIFYIVQYPYGT